MESYYKINRIQLINKNEDVEEDEEEKEQKRKKKMKMKKAIMDTNFEIIYRGV